LRNEFNAAFIRSIGLGDLNASKDAAAFRLKVGRELKRVSSNLLILDPFTPISDSARRRQMMPLIYRIIIRYFIIFMLFWLKFFFLKSPESDHGEISVVGARNSKISKSRKLIDSNFRISIAASFAIWLKQRCADRIRMSEPVALGPGQTWKRNFRRLTFS